jgi:hypothetical protein
VPERHHLASTGLFLHHSGVYRFVSERCFGCCRRSLNELMVWSYALVTVTRRHSGCVL